MKQLKIKEHPEYSKLLRPLSDEEFEQLEKTILEEGIRDPICTWQGYIIDGHNRYQIAVKHKIEYSVKEYDFSTEEEVKDWVDQNQIGRRNLNSKEFTVIIGRIYNRQKKNPHGRSDRKFGVAKSSTPKTSVAIASRYGISEKTVRNAGIQAEAIDKLEKETGESGLAIVNKFPNSTEVQKFAKCVKDNPDKSATQVLTEITRKSKREEVSKKVLLGDKEKRYSVIISLPRWDCTDGFKPYAAPYNYPSVPVEEIKKISLNDRSEKNSVLFMWVPSSLLDKGLDLMKNWEFIYKNSYTILTKESHKTLFNQLCHEHLLIGVKGVCPPEILNPPRSVIELNSFGNRDELKNTIQELIDNLYPKASKYLSDGTE